VRVNYIENINENPALLKIGLTAKYPATYLHVNRVFMNVLLSDLPCSKKKTMEVRCGGVFHKSSLKCSNSWQFYLLQTIKHLLNSVLLHPFPIKQGVLLDAKQRSMLRTFWSLWRVEKILATKIAVKVANLVTCVRLSPNWRLSLQF